MMYNSVLARSFSKHEQKRLGYGAIICCLIIALLFCALFKPSLGPVPALNLQVSMGVGLKMLAVKATNSSQQMTLKNAIHENKNNHWPKPEPRNVSDHFQEGNSTSQHGHHDWEQMSTNGSRNVTSGIQRENSTNTPQHRDWEVNTNVPRNVTLQVENSTTSQQYPGNTSTTTPTATNDRQTELLIKEVVTKKMEPVVLCNTEEPRSEFCEVKTDARVDARSSSVFVISSSQMNQHMSAQGNDSLTAIRPYARKEDTTAMSYVRKWSVLLKPEEDSEGIPKCTRKHSVPAILFSVGGYVGNNFHEFTDVIIPLFITSRQYNREVQFLITDYRPYFVIKYQKLLKGLSKYEPIVIDKEGQQVHCFPGATIGLKRHPQEMSIDPEKHSTSIKEFRGFLRNVYSLNKVKAITIGDNLHRKKPRLLILSRRRTRAFTNTGEIRAMARSLGYKVTIAEADSNLSRFSELVNSCDVLMGVHGAGLTNIVFLPENAVFIQILPFGGFEWLAKTDFGLPSKDMNLNYLEYKISKEESTLLKQYPHDHAVFTDPPSIGKQGWEAFKSIYLEKQNVNLDVNRFKPTLVKALQLLHHQ